MINFSDVMKDFWVQIYKNTMFNPLSPSLCLLGDIAQVNLPIKYRNPLLISLTLAKKTILLKWKSKQSLNINHQINLLLDLISIEKITPNKCNISVFNDTWNPFHTLLN